MAFIANQNIMGALKNSPLLGHITTFGGHPISAAASLATVQALQEETLIEQVEAKADLFRSLLVHPKIKNIRNKDLMMAVQFDSFEALKPVIDFTKMAFLFLHQGVKHLPVPYHGIY